MRLTALSAVVVAAISTPAWAAPAAIEIVIGPELQKSLDKTYGQREADVLTKDLRDSVETALARTDTLDGAQIELTLVDAKPNRPTFKQLSEKPGLSMESFGVGGATIEGRVTAADGVTRTIAYRWYETDLRNAYGAWVWSDATSTFDRFARRLARGDELAHR